MSHAQAELAANEPIDANLGLQVMAATDTCFEYGGFIMIYPPMEISPTIVE